MRIFDFSNDFKELQKVGKNSAKIFYLRRGKNDWEMATLLYRISSKVDKVTGQSEVLVRFFHGNLDQRAKTNIFIKPGH